MSQITCLLPLDGREEPVSPRLVKSVSCGSPQPRRARGFVPDNDMSRPLYPVEAAHRHKGMERRLQMLGSGLGLVAIGLMGLWEIVLRLR